jgi:hypothetical protein
MEQPVMKKIPLSEYLELPGKSQQGLAASFNLTQGAISKMHRSGRNIFVIEHDDGRLELLEEKAIATTSSVAA